ncbi:MAG: hypothetical protein PVF73_07050 [Bacteroidales bacterium]|jgi:hypothetical protein
MIIRYLKIRLGARALYLAVIISFVSAVYAFMFILSRYYGFVEIRSLDAFRQLSDNCRSAIHIAMQQESYADFGKAETKILFNDTLNEVQLLKRHWGVYNIVSAGAGWKSHRVKRTALYGRKTGGESPTGLYLADHGHYLAVGGDTYLSGHCYLPELGARKAYIEGRSFKYRTVIDGSTGKSRENLPPLPVSFPEHIKNYLLMHSGTPDTLAEEKILNSDKLENSFENKTIRISSEEYLVLDRIDIKGNYIIQSRDRIIIGENARLENIICIAPAIIVQEGFEGKVQLIALDSIAVGNDVVLRYPSAIVGAGIGRSSVHVAIGSNSRVEGCIAAFAEIAEELDVQVRTESGSEVYGLVYCAGKMEHRGKIFGSLYCDRFFLQTRQGYYENHLLDAWVDPDGLEKSFAAGLVFEDQDEKPVNRIIEWLN